MKIAHFGNIANVPYLLAWGMKKFYGVESIIFMPRKPDPISKKYLYGYESGNPYGINIIYVAGAIRSPHRHIDTLRALIQGRVDIGHVHQGGVIDSLETKISRANILFHFHGSDLRRWLAVDTWRRRYYHSGLVGEDKILVSTPDLLSFLSWKDASKKAEHLPNPIDPAFYESRIEGEKDHTIFFPTRHDEEIKRTSVAFDAWRILRKLNSEARLKTIMWGKDFPVFYQKFKDDNRMTWLPVLSRAEYIKQLRSSSIIWGQFVLGINSLIELETMAASKPLVHYWRREYCGRDFYDDPLPLDSHRSPYAIAHVTNSLLEDEKKRRRMGSKLQRWVLKYHSLKTVSQRLYEIYEQIT